MSVAYVIEFHVREGAQQRFLHLITGVLDAMKAEATYKCATLHVYPEDPLHFLLHEVWADHEDVVTVQLHRPYRREWHDALPHLLVGERQISIWRPVHQGWEADQRQ